MYGAAKITDNKWAVVDDEGRQLEGVELFCTKKEALSVGFRMSKALEQHNMRTNEEIAEDVDAQEI
jgi:hypothetical protein